jgi:hypothetical protein
MNKMLSAEQIEQFHDQGYIKGIRVLDDEQLEQARELFEKVTAGLAEKGLTHNDVNGWWAVHKGFWDVCKTPAILDCFEDLLGPDLFIWGGQYFCKAPGDGKTVPWHQDISYWPLKPAEHNVSAWIALYDTDASNGCMKVIPGSHKAVLEHAGELKSSDVLAQALTPSEIDESQAIDFDLKAGEMSLHTDALAHCSEANTGDRIRCGMTMRVSSPDVKADLEAWPTFSWARLRGTDPGELNPCFGPPTGEVIPTGYNQFSGVNAGT